MHNMTICICLIARLSCWLYPYIQFHLNFYANAGYLSNNKRMRLFWVSGNYDIKGNEETDRLPSMGSDSHFCELKPCIPLSVSIVRDMIALNSQSCKQPNTS
jgi:hypothetical protein